MIWKELTKIGISGSRKFPEHKLDMVTQYIDYYISKKFKSTEDVVIITGGSHGVDDVVALYCMRRGIKNLIIHARWLELELVAGPRRNQHIVDLSNIFMAFWDGTSRGTKDSIDKAKIKFGDNKEKFKIFSPDSLEKRIDKLGIKINKVSVIPARESRITREARQLAHPKKKKPTGVGRGRGRMSMKDLIKTANFFDEE